MLLILFFSCSTQSGNEENQGQIVQETDSTKAILVNCNFTETPLDLSTHPVEKSEASKLIDSTNFLLKATNQQTINPLLETIPLSILNELKSMACSLDHTCSGNPGKVTAVRFRFAMDNTFRLYCVYEPLLLCSPTVTEETEFSVHSSEIFKVINGGQLSDLSTGQFNDTTQYKIHIKFLDSTDTTHPRDHNIGQDYMSITYTFQELEAIMNHNSTLGIKLWSFASRKNGVTRHSIIVSPDTYDYFSESLSGNLNMIFKNKLGDHANPCPPQCERITLRCN